MARDTTIVIPVFNQREITMLCLDRLRASEGRHAGLVAIDNGSTDGTREYLETLREAVVIRNDRNLGVAKAWNQGWRSTASSWILFLNNDVVVPPGWLSGLLGVAEREGFQVVSPGIREGPLNYDLNGFAGRYTSRMASARRLGAADGACFLVRRSVLETVGGFDENFRLGQFEDTDFFLRAAHAGFGVASAGSSFVHHFLSVTQKAIRERGESGYERENRLYFRSKWRLTQPRRFFLRWKRKRSEFLCRTVEWFRHGHALKEKWVRSQWVLR